MISMFDLCVMYWYILLCLSINIRLMHIMYTTCDTLWCPSWVVYVFESWMMYTVLKVLFLSMVVQQSLSETHQNTLLTHSSSLTASLLEKELSTLPVPLISIINFLIVTGKTTVLWNNIYLFFSFFNLLTFSSLWPCTMKKVSNVSITEDFSLIFSQYFYFI